ncbi:MAG TPA: serine hydrolase domain-containing protein [Anaerolineaceae bacterium]|nr:serine hydrolase domain-containing protein [Anaerolineaceae bacterium]
MSKISSELIHGEVAPGFEAVREAYAHNYSIGAEIGSALAVYHRGKRVVHLWGGLRDREKNAPWQEDTLALVFSTTKGLSALALALAHSRGWLDYDRRVCEYWPEFAQNGKERVTVRQLLSHQAGLITVDYPRLDYAVLHDLDALAAILARQKPAWEPGTRNGYHAFTLGFYENELFRRVDPEGRSLGRFFQEAIARPLGAEFYIGLPPEIPLDRIAKQYFAPVWTMFTNLKMIPFGMNMMNKRSYLGRAFSNPTSALTADFTHLQFRNLEMPATSGIGTADGIARIYGAFAAGGAELGLRPETLAELKAPARIPTGGSLDLVMGIPLQFSLGLGKPFNASSFCPNPAGFGWPGMGGSLGFADPVDQIGFGYNMNKMNYNFGNDPRLRPIRDAIYRSIRAFDNQAT